MDVLCGNPFVLFLIFLFGISMGSFLNVLIYRIPNGMSIISPPSSCPVCKKKIKPWHNVPVFGWIFLRGKCAYCGADIQVQYPLVELFSGILAVFVFKINGCGIYSFVIFGIFWLLLGLSLIDLKYKAVPDSLSLTALTLSFFVSPDILENAKNVLTAMGFLSALRFYVSYFKDEESMGEADIIIGGIIGGVLGIKYAFWGLFAASVIALPFILYYNIKKKEPEMPFIPFLSTGLLIVWTYINIK